jgi:hypothetical protein
MFNVHRRSLRHAQPYCATAINSRVWKFVFAIAVALSLSACWSSEKVYWLVCDGYPLVKNTRINQLRDVSRGHWIEHEVSYPTYVPLERYSVCKIIPETELHPSIAERAQ